MARTVSFDVDGTLVLPSFNDLIWFEVVPQLFAAKEGMGFEEARNLVSSKYEELGPSDLRWYDLNYWLRLLRLEDEQGSILEEYADRVEVYDDVLPCLEDLSSRYDLVVASGMPREFIEVKLEKDNIKRFFGERFSSISDFGVVKKDAQFYSRMCSALGIPPGELVHIGDHYHADYLAALSSGALGFHLDRTHSRERHLGIVYDLGEVSRRLGAG